jgi:serine/threonine-protein kinase
MEATTAYRRPGNDGGPDLGERFGDYQLLGEIGRGAMGVVYRARPVGTNLVVALKRLRPGGGAGADAARQFREEIEAVSGLRHRNIVPVYHVREDSGGPFYTMALVEGGSLDAKMSHFRDDARAAVRLVAKVAWAVHHAHQRRILHRDLKPSNILLEEDGEPRVADFGLATRLSEIGSVADSGSPAGSLPWMAPEAVRGDPVLTTAVDVWAIGVILFELLTGARPFRADGRAQLAAAILNTTPPPRDVNPAVDRDLDAVCRRCLASEPDRRYESASAVALELERWLRDEPVHARQPGRRERFARWCRRNPALTATAFLLMSLSAVGTAALVSLARERDEATRRAVCRDNEYTAELAAGAFLRRIEAHKTFIREVAEDRAVRSACAADNVEAARAEMRRWFDRQPAPSAVPIATLYLLDPSSTLRAVWGVPTERPSVEGERFGYRDYYQGARALALAGRTGSDSVHVSRVFRARSDGLDKLAVSIAFRPTKGAELWVLAATIPTDPTLGLGVRDDARHKVVLLAPRESPSPPVPNQQPELVVLVHPSYEPREESIPFPAEQLRWRPSPDGRIGFAPDDNYQDPVKTRHAECQGRWLAGFAPVEGTEMVVVVQQRDDDALAPERSFFRQFLAWAAGLTGGAALAAFATFRLARSRRAGIEKSPA